MKATPMPLWKQSLATFRTEQRCGSARLLHNTSPHPLPQELLHRLCGCVRIEPLGLESAVQFP